MIIHTYNIYIYTHVYHVNMLIGMQPNCSWLRNNCRQELRCAVMASDATRQQKTTRRVHGGAVTAVTACAGPGGMWAVVKRLSGTDER